MAGSQRKSLSLKGDGQKSRNVGTKISEVTYTFRGKCSHSQKQTLDVRTINLFLHILYMYTINHDTQLDCSRRAIGPPHISGKPDTRAGLGSAKPLPPPRLPVRASVEDATDSPDSGRATDGSRGGGATTLEAKTDPDDASRARAACGGACVCKRERGRECASVQVCECESVCVCVYVCVRERERGTLSASHPLPALASAPEVDAARAAARSRARPARV